MKASLFTSLLAVACSTVLALPVAPKLTIVHKDSSRNRAITLYGDTSNQLSLCRPITIIFARGTTEFGNVGLFAGPAFFDALANKIGSQNLGVQGVPYEASIFGYLEGGDPAGATMFAQMADQAAAQCPHTQIVLSGYSQGAMMVHLGARQMAASTLARVKAVVMFGDPFNGQAIPSISANVVDTFCFSYDLICKDTIFVNPFHLLYSVDAGPAADFVTKLISL